MKKRESLNVPHPGVILSKAGDRVEGSRNGKAFGAWKGLVQAKHVQRSFADAQDDIIGWMGGGPIHAA